MIEIFGLMKRLLIDLVRMRKSRLTFSLFFKLLIIYNKKPNSSGTINDGKWIIEYSDSRSFFYTYYEIFFRQVYDLDHQANQPLSILDVGSNIGLSILSIKEKFPHCHIKAIEADPGIYKILERNMKTNHITGVELINKAAWSEEGKLSFSSDNSDGGSVASDQSAKNLIEVESFDLAAYLKRQSFDFIKMDIEGAENELFPHIKEELIRCPRIFIEYHSLTERAQTLGEILAYFGRNGFRYNLVSLSNNWAPFTQRHHGGRFDGQYNIWFRRD